MIKEGIALADRHGFVMAAQRGYQNVFGSFLRFGDKADRRRTHDAAVAHARRYGLRPSMQLNREIHFLFEDANWDAALRIAEDERDNAHAVRRYRNGVVHEGGEGAEAVSLRQAKSYLCLFFSRLPLTW